MLRPQQDPPSPEGPAPIADYALLVAADSGEVPLPIRINRPVPAQQGSWTCRYEIGWPEGMRAIDVAGNDSMQALILAIHMIGAELYTSEYHRTGQLRDPANPEGGYGFPVPNSLRDLLVGSDRRFF